jgi:hypothetical protein
MCTVDQLNKQLISHCVFGDATTVSALLELGADVECNNGSPVIAAAGGGHLSIIYNLINHGAYRCATDLKALKIAVDMATFNNHYEVASELKRFICHLETSMKRHLVDDAMQ